MGHWEEQAQAHIIKIQCEKQPHRGDKLKLRADVSYSEGNKPPSTLTPHFEFGGVLKQD